MKDFFELRENKDKFVVKYAMSKKGPIRQMPFHLLVYAKQFLADKEKEGYKGIISKNGKPVKESVELDEATAKIKTTMSDKVCSGAKRFGLKATTSDGHVSISGPKGKLNDFLRAIIGKSSFGNASDITESVELDEAKLSDMGVHNKIADRNLIIKAIKTAEKMDGNMTGAVREIEKMKKGLSKHKAVQAALQQANESVELDEAADFEKISKELLKHKSKGVEFEKAAAFTRVMFMNSSLHVQDRAFVGLTKLLKDMDDLVKKTTITKILKDNGFRVKGGKLMREGVESIDENYRTLATKGMGPETKNSINVGRDIDFYEPKNGDKRTGKITKMTKTGFVVKDEKDGKSYAFAYYDRTKAKALLSK